MIVEPAEEHVYEEMVQPAVPANVTLAVFRLLNVKPGALKVNVVELAQITVDPVETIEPLMNVRFLIHEIDPEKVIVPAVLISKGMLKGWEAAPLIVPEPFIVSVAVPGTGPPLLLLVKFPPTSTLRPTPLIIGIDVGIVKFPLNVMSDVSVDVVRPIEDVAPF